MMTYCTKSSVTLFHTFVGCSDACQEFDDPMCDTNGKTHPNDCMLLFAMCQAAEKGETLGFAHFGSCRGKTKAVVKQSMISACSSVSPFVYLSIDLMNLFQMMKYIPILIPIIQNVYLTYRLL